VLVVGLNPFRLLDEKYRGFFSLVADQIATSFSNVHAMEEERKRLEALAKIDKAKTTFFSNISHEFRTPLTLLLSPVEDVMNDTSIGPENIARMQVAYRNALRMQKLVNTLLEFSRIEAGRIEGKFQRVDICSLTEDLASTFRSAIERAGMKLIIACAVGAEEVYVDGEMWERIVLNLVSNAFKYSKQGEIRVTTDYSNGMVSVAVADTGSGIPADQLDRIFERFHRVDNTEGRSQEGTGIGLAMVKELVKLHGGSIHVSSEVGKGSVFTVSIPAGKDHIAPEKIVKEEAAPAFKHSAAFMQEAMKWLPDDTQTKEQAAEKVYANTENRARVLIADDNADMREYGARIMSQHFELDTRADGQSALAEIRRRPPDLVIADVMMSGMDGLELLRELRRDPGTRARRDDRADQDHRARAPGRGRPEPVLACGGTRSGGRLVRGLPLLREPGRAADRTDHRRLRQPRR
jgi:signal transduction histidine kinase/CheY-like chemotaxis protein